MKVTATRQVEHDLVTYQEGDTIELSDSAAEALIACGAAQAVAAPSKKAKKEAPDE